MATIHGNFLGAAIVCIINLVFVNTGKLKKVSRNMLILINVVLDLLIIVLMAFAFRQA